MPERKKYCLPKIEVVEHTTAPGESNWHRVREERPGVKKSPEMEGRELKR
jgi:hypothetical protein